MTPPPASHAPVKGWVQSGVFANFSQFDEDGMMLWTREGLEDMPVLVLPLDASGGVGEDLVERCAEALYPTYGPNDVRAVLSALVSAATTETGT